MCRRMPAQLGPSQHVAAHQVAACLLPRPAGFSSASPLLLLCSPLVASWPPSPAISPRPLAAALFAGLVPASPWSRLQLSLAGPSRQRVASAACLGFTCLLPAGLDLLFGALVEGFEGIFQGPLTCLTLLGLCRLVSSSTPHPACHPTKHSLVFCDYQQRQSVVGLPTCTSLSLGVSAVALPIIASLRGLAHCRLSAVLALGRGLIGPRADWVRGPI